MGNGFKVFGWLKGKFLLRAVSLTTLGIVLVGSTVVASSVPSELADVKQWLRETAEIAKALRAERVSVTEWQDKMEALNKTLSYPKLLNFLNFEQLVRRIKYPRDIAAVREVYSSIAQGLPNKFIFNHKVFAYRRGAITPTRAHNNMVSAHLVLKGSFHLRTFHRVRDEAGAIWLRSSIDKEISAGDIITMSDDRNNVHSFVASSDYAYLLEIPVSHVNLKKSYALKADAYSMIYADPSGKPGADGLIRAPVLEFEEALRRFSGT